MQVCDGMSTSTTLACRAVCRRAPLCRCCGRSSGDTDEWELRQTTHEEAKGHLRKGRRKSAWQGGGGGFELRLLKHTVATARAQAVAYLSPREVELEERRHELCLLPTVNSLLSPTRVHRKIG